MNTDFWKIFALVITILLALSLAINIAFVLKKSGLISQSASLIQPVSAQKIYPLFECPCCGKPIDGCTCPMAEERRDFVDGLVKTESSEDEILTAYIKKYGLDSFLDKSKQKEFREKLVVEAPADRPIVSLNPASYDLGDVSQKKGKVFTFFDIRNKGKSDLVIDRLETSCGCTFAAVVFGGEESPYFTMPGHGYENTEWAGVSIPAGETARLKVMYDPDVHQDFRGPATREIYVFSNDPIDFEKKVQIELNQVD